MFLRRIVLDFKNSAVPPINELYFILKALTCELVIVGLGYFFEASAVMSLISEPPVDAWGICALTALYSFKVFLMVSCMSLSFSCC